MRATSFPRYLAITVVLSAVIATAMLSVFYAQYRWLAGALVESSGEHYAASIAVGFERRELGRLQRIADSIILHNILTDEPELGGLLQAAISGDPHLVGLHFVDSAGRTTTVGEFDLAGLGAPDSLPPERQQIPFVVEEEGRVIGTLYGELSLVAPQADIDRFQRQLIDEEQRQRQQSIVWIGGTAVLSLALCCLVIWLVVQEQSRRIRILKRQAEKISAANFREALQIESRDELGELAQVFETMRMQLQRTTVSRNYMDKILSGMNEAIIITDAEGRITRVNNATSRMLEYDENELLGRPISEIVEYSKGGELRTDLAGGMPGEATFLSRSGSQIPVSYTGSLIESDGSTQESRIYAAQNISERRKAEQRIRYLARIDTLTKVPNRMQFQHLLQRAIARAKRSQRPLALFYIDIDQFKEINDTFGHLAGDTTLETVANRLTEALPDDCIIGRLAGDEFAVIVDNQAIGAGSSADGIDRLARKTLDRLADPFYVQGHEVFMTASMGIACYPKDAPNVIDLIRNADAALYQAKKSGGNVFTYYEREMNDAAVERLITKSKLKRAFERNELLVRYQPKYNIETGKVIGAEALVRWDLPERGIILPADFIPIAEETNLIVEIGEWVLDRVCEDFRYWQRSVSSPGRVSVNLSLKQLRHASFLSRIAGILRSYEVSPTSLELEITETTLMENAVRTVKVLDELYALGLHLAIDDFGTGYSSLSALQQFPISTLKVDRSFVQDVAVNADDAAIVNMIIQMGKSLNMDVVAEGVETEEQLNCLREMNCAYVQGLLFGDPVSSDDYLELLLAQAEGTDKYRALFA